MSILITQTDSTSNSVTIWVYGMDINYPHKILDAKINGSYYNSYEDPNSGFGMYCTIEGLSPNTSYSLEIIAFHYYNGLYQPDPGTDENFATITISTSGSGPSPGNTPTYRAYESNGNLEIDIINAGSGCEISTYLFNSPSSQSYIDRHLNLLQSYDTYSGLSNGTYYVEVDYRDNDTNWTTIYNNNGQIRAQVVIRGGSPSTDDGYVYIYTGSQWRKAKPYIFNGVSWKPATAYVFNGSTWKKTTST